MQDPLAHCTAEDCSLVHTQPTDFALTQLELIHYMRRVIFEAIITGHDIPHRLPRFSTKLDGCLFSQAPVHSQHIHPQPLIRTEESSICQALKPCIRI